MTAVAPRSEPAPAYPPVTAKDGSADDSQDKQKTRGVCWAFKEGMRRDVLFTNINSWAEGPFFWKDMYCFWCMGVCCAVACLPGATCYGIARVYTSQHIATVKTNLDTMIAYYDKTGKATVEPVADTMV